MSATAAAPPARRCRRRHLWVEPGVEIPYEPRASDRDARIGPSGRQTVALVGVASALSGAVLTCGAPRRGAALGLGALVTIGAVDQLVDPTERDLRVRVAANAAHATFLTAWLAGVVHGAAAGRPDPTS